MSVFTVTVTEEAVAPAAVETIIQAVAGAARGLDLIRWSLSLNGVTPTDAPARVQLCRMMSAGTSTLVTPVKMDAAADAVAATARTAFTAEPTLGDVLETYALTPYGGLIVMDYAPDSRIRVAANNRLGLRVLASAAVNVSAYMVFAE